MLQVKVPGAGIGLALHILPAPLTLSQSKHSYIRAAITCIAETTLRQVHD